MTRNLERSYDGIIIGAGHHGLILGCYLARSGLKVLLVERRLDYGGGLSTREVTKPGFYHNLHSINHFHIGHTPWFADLKLADKVTYITPRYEFGQAHKDGTALVFGRDLEETVINVARFSKQDAVVFREWNRKAEEVTRRVLIPERYSEPLPQAERERLLSMTTVGRDFLEIARRQPLDVVDELFENEHVKLLFLFKVSLFGTWLTDTLSKTSPMGSVIRAFDLDSGYQLCQGGSFNLARGLMETFSRRAAPTSRRSISIASSSKAAAPRASRLSTGGLCAPEGLWRARSMCIRLSKNWLGAIRCRESCSKNSTTSATPAGRCLGCI